MYIYAKQHERVAAKSRPILIELVYRLLVARCGEEVDLRWKVGAGVFLREHVRRSHLGVPEQQNRAERARGERCSFSDQHAAFSGLSIEN